MGLPYERVKSAFMTGFLSTMKRAGLPTSSLGPIAEVTWFRKSSAMGEMTEAAVGLVPSLGEQMFNQFADAGEHLEASQERRARLEELKRLEEEEARKSAAPPSFGMLRPPGYRRV